MSSAPVRSAIAQLKTSLAGQDEFGRVTQAGLRRTAGSRCSRRPSRATPTSAEATSAIRHLRADLIPQAFGDSDDDGARRRDDRRERRLLRHRRQLAPDRVRLRARPQLHPADGRLPLDRDPGGRDRAQPALGRGRVRAARARLPEGRRERALRLPAGRRRSRPGCRSSSSRCSSVSRWTTRCSCSAGSRSATRRPATPRGSVAFGVGSTARLITGAALIIIAVFGGFAAGDLVMFQQMGFGVARGAPHRRHDRPLRSRAGEHEAPRRAQLVPPLVAGVDPGRPRRRTFLR